MSTRVWRGLLERVLPTSVRTELLGDLDELYAWKREMEGRPAADAWYRRQAMAFAWRAVAQRKQMAGPNGSEGRRPVKMDVLAQDVRLALRAIRRRPGFALISILTLALGIGANTAVFSAVNGVLLRDLPYDSPDRIVRVFGYNVREGMEFGTISYPNFEDWRERSTSFAQAAAYDEYQPLVTDGAEPERLPGASVNASFFDVLGVRPALGRFFLPAEDAPGSAHSVVLSWGLWQRRYGGETDVVGRPIQLNGIAYTIVGVAPRDFEDPELSGGSFATPQLWRVTPSYFGTANRGSRSYTAIARLRDEVTLAQAQQDLDRIMVDLAREFPDNNANRAVVAQTLLDDITAEARTPLLVLLGAAGLVLLIACANVANLALVRALDSERDFVVRAAVGASRARLATQVMVENAVLAALGGAAGLALAIGGVRLLRTLAGADLARGANIAIDLPVLAFASGAVLFAGLLFGAAPLLMVGRTDLSGALREGGRTSTVGRRRRRLQKGLVIAEVALSCALLVGAGLLIRSLAALQRVDTGVRADGMMVMSMDMPTFAYDTIAEVTQVIRAVEERINALPGVRIAGVVDILPMSGSFNGNGFRIEGRPEPAPGESPSAETRAVTAGAFGAMGIEVARGRGITEADRAGTLPVVVINEAMARRFWADEDPMGARILLIGEMREVVGIVRDVREFTPDRAPEPGVYVPHEQAPDWIRSNAQTVVVRTDGDPLAVAGAVRSTLREIEPRAALGEPRAMQAVVDRTLSAPRFRTLLLAGFAGVALLLAIVGIYGVVSRTVAQRRHEVGIRMSLGAKRGDVLSLLLGEGLRPVLAGVALGLAGGFALARALTGLLFGVGALDPLTFLAAPVALTLAAAAACLLPASGASRTDPATVLRID